MIVDGYIPKEIDYASPIEVVDSINQDNLIFTDSVNIQSQSIISEPIRVLTPEEKLVLWVTGKVQAQQVAEEVFVQETVEKVVHLQAEGIEQVYELIDIDIPYTHEEQEYLLLKESGLEDAEIEEILDVDPLTPAEKMLLKLKGVFLKIKVIFKGYSWLFIPIIFIVGIYIIYKFIQTFVITKAQKVAKKKIKLK